MKARIPFSINSKEKKAINEEINKQILERDAQFSLDFDSIVLWVLHNHFGFGKKRLRKFYDTFTEVHSELREYYQLEPEDNGWICRLKLKEMGVDVEEWYKEINK